MMRGRGLELSFTFAALVDAVDVVGDEIIGRGTKTKYRERRAETGKSAMAAAVRLVADATFKERSQLMPKPDALGGKF